MSTAVVGYRLYGTGIGLLQKIMQHALLFLCIAQVGCTPVSHGQAYQAPVTLYAILTEDQSTGVPKYRIAADSEKRGTWVVRRGVRLDVTPNMRLNTGDEVWTGPGSAVAIRFANGSQLYLRANGHIRIGSIFAFVGELFVRVKGAFQVDTEFVTAGAEGTEWVMTISPNGDTRCIVLEGRITVASNRQLWKPMSVGANNQGMAYGAVWDMTSVPANKMSEIRNWVGQIDSLARETQPRTIDDNRPFPFIIQFNSYRRQDRDPRDDRPERTDTDHRPYPKPREDSSR